MMTNAVALAVGGVVAQIAFVTLEAVIGRQLGVSAYGLFSSLYAYVLVMVHVLDLGVQWQLLQEGSRDQRSLSPNLGTALIIKLVAFLAAYPLVLSILIWSGRSPEFVWSFAILAFFGLSMMLNDVMANVFGALQRMGVNAVFQAAIPVAMLGAVLVAGLQDPTLIRVVLACVAGAGFVTLLWYLFTTQVVRPRAELRRCVVLLRNGYHYGITITLNAVYYRLGVLLLSVLRDPAEVGIFAAAYKLLDLGFKLPTLGIRAIAPKLFADSVSTPQKFRWEVELLIRGTMVLSALMAVVIFALGPDLVQMIFGAAFAAAALPARIIGLALALKSVALVAQTVLSTADEHRYRTRADAVTMVAGIVIAVPLITWKGAVGAAIAVAMADLIWAGAMLSRVDRHLPDTGLGKIVLAPVVGTGIGVLSSVLWSGHFVISALISSILLLMVLVASGYLHPVFRALREVRAN